MQELLDFSPSSHWRIVKRVHPAARKLADAHYSRQTVGAVEFLPPGRTLVLLTHDELAVWGVCENKDPAGGHQWRVTIFRNEGPVLSSDLVREATKRTYDHWVERYGMPEVPLTTEVDPQKTRRKRDPGRCFRKAGWIVIGQTRSGLILLTHNVPA